MDEAHSPPRQGPARVVRTTDLPAFPYCHDGEQSLPAAGALDANDANDANLAILLALLTMPLQRVEDLALMAGVSLRTAYRHLARLQPVGLVDTLSTGNLGRASCHLAYLTRAGVRALAGGDPADAHALARAWRCDLRDVARLLPRLPARIALLQTLPPLLMAYRHAALGCGGTARKLRNDQHAPGCWETPTFLRWHWALDYHHAFTYRERAWRLAVDAILAVRAAGSLGYGDGRTPGRGVQQGRPRASATETTAEWHAVWVLLDPGVGNASAFVARLSALVAYRESAARWPVYGQFPPVLIVTASPHRASIWRQAAREAALRLRADPLVGVIQVVPPGAVSCWPLSVPGTVLPLTVPEPTTAWIDLASGVPTTLSALFATALPETALPPGITTLPLAPLVLGNSSGATTACTPTAISGARPRPAPAAHHSIACAGHQGDRAGAPRLRATTTLSARPADTLSRWLARAHPLDHPGPLDSDQRMLLRGRLALSLTRREHTLLDMIATHPLVCQDDLAVWMDLAPAWVDRLRRELRQAGLVQAYPVDRDTFLPLRSTHVGEVATTSAPLLRTAATAPSGKEVTYLLRLTPLAWNYLATVYHLPARHLAGGAALTRATLIAPATTTALSAAAHPPVRPLPSPHLPAHAVHQASVYRFLTLLQQDLDGRARDGDGGPEHLVWWEGGAACARRYRLMGRWGTLLPDAAGECLCGGRRVRFWLEWDTGSMGLSALREKFERYATYVQTSAWRAEDAHSLPVLLIIVPDIAQERRMMRLVDELRQRRRLQWPGPLLIRTTTATRLEREGPLAAIWLSLLPPPAPTSPTERADADACQHETHPPKRLIHPLERVPPVLLDEMQRNR